MKKFRTFSLILAFSLLFSLAGPGAQALEEPERLSAQAVLLVDLDSGLVLYERNADQQRTPASLTKIMTILLALEAAERGEVSLDDPVTAGPDCRSGMRDDSSSVGIRAGEQMSLRDLLYCAAVASGNDACNVIAAYLAGSIPGFVERMNERAAELGWTTARFYSPHGLPVFAGGAVPAKRQNEMSAMDFFKLCAYLLKNERQITEITSLQYANLPTLKYSTFNTNTLVFNVPGVTGLKTGSTDRAGKCVAVSLPITREGETHNIVLVLLGAETTALRDQAGEILLRWAQDHYAAADFRLAA